MDFHSQWNHRWITPKAQPYHSPIHELGVVAIKDIPRGEIVFVYGGVIIPRDEIKSFWNKIGHVGIQIDDDFFICPTSREELEKRGIVNHSCNPNLGFKNSVVLIAIKDIKSGEEVTFDYAFSESFIESFKCNCGNLNCRGTITQDDWKSGKIQQDYRNYSSPYLKEKFVR